MAGLYQNTEEKPCFYLGHCEPIHRKENIFLRRQEYQRLCIRLYCMFSLKKLSVKRTTCFYCRVEANKKQQLRIMISSCLNTCGFSILPQKGQYKQLLSDHIQSVLLGAPCLARCCTPSGFSALCLWLPQVCLLSLSLDQDIGLNLEVTENVLQDLQDASNSVTIKRGRKVSQCDVCLSSMQDF